MDTTKLIRFKLNPKHISNYFKSFTQVDSLFLQFCSTEMKCSTVLAASKVLIKKTL